MRRTPKTPPPGNERPAPRTLYPDEYRSEQNSLEPPRRDYGRTAADSIGTYGARRPEPERRPPVQRQYKPYNLDAFEREKTVEQRLHSDYNFDAFSSQRRSIPRTEQPVQRRQPSGPRERQPQRRTPPSAQQRQPGYDAQKQQQVRSGMRSAQAAPRRVQRESASYRNREEQRRAQNQRRLKRLRRRRITTAVLLLLTLVIVAVSLCFTVFFKIDKIQIKGTDLYTEEQILHMLDFKRGDNMLMVNRKDQAAALPNKLPYIKSAVIQLSLPSTIVVTVEPAEAKYYFQGDDGLYSYFDNTMKVLETGAQTLPETAGAVSLEKTAFKKLETGKKAVFADEKIQAAMEEILKAIESVKLEHVTGIMVINEATNYVIYDNRITIKLGTATKVEEKLLLAKTSIEDAKNDDVLSQPDTKGTLDMTLEKFAYFTEST